MKTSSAVLCAALLASAVHAAAIDNVTPAQWAALSQAVGGRLYTSSPLGRPCYASYNNTPNVPDANKCAEVQKGYTYDQYLVTQPPAFLNTNWGICQATGQGCNLMFNQANQMANTSVHPPSGPVCYQGSVSQRYIQVGAITDYQAALAFSAITKVPIVIKNTGHDYKGRSSAPNSLQVWTNKVQPPITLNKSFVAKGCAASTAKPAVSFGAGQGFLGLYEFCEKNNCTFVGGSSPTVGTAGGWITGGGHSSVSNTLGMGVDNALEITAVTGTGKIVVANRCQNQDLFYALRGGGGATFGIIYNMTSMVHPQLNLQVAYIRFISLSPDNLRGFLKVLIENAVQLAQNGWGGYIEPNAMSNQASGLVLFTPKLNNAQAKASMKNITDYAASITNVPLNNEVDEGGSFYEAYQKYLVPNEEIVGIGTSIGSRLIPTENFVGAANQSTLLDALVNVANTQESGQASNPIPANPLLLTYGAPLQFLVTSPYNYPDDKTSSITPVWRNTIWHVFINSVFSNEATSDVIAKAFQQSHTAANFLRAITPGGSSYINEADTYEIDPATTFWGQANFARLTTLKKQFDPLNLLTNHQAIGWNSSDVRYACYPPAPTSASGSA